MWMHVWQNGRWLKIPLDICRNCRVCPDRTIWSIVDSPLVRKFRSWLWSLTRIYFHFACKAKNLSLDLLLNQRFQSTERRPKCKSSNAIPLRRCNFNALFLSHSARISFVCHSYQLGARVKKSRILFLVVVFRNFLCCDSILMECNLI